MAQPALTLEGSGPERRSRGAATIPDHQPEADRWSRPTVILTALAAAGFAGIVTTANILLISRSAILAGAFTALMSAAAAAGVTRQVRRYRLDAEQRVAQAKVESARAAEDAIRAANEAVTRVEQAKVDDKFAAAGALARARRDAEDTRKAMSLQLDTAVSNMTQGLVMFDATGRLIVCNDRYVEMYGQTRDVVKPGAMLRDILRHRRDTGTFVGDPDTYFPQITAAIARCKALTEVVELADGRTISIVVREMADHGWVATHEDITSQRRVERELDRAQKFLLSVVENVPTVIVVKDARELRYLLVNRATEKFYGLPRGEIMGRTTHQLFPKATADLIVAHDRQLLQSKRELFLGEHEVDTPGHGRRRVVARCLPVCDERGEPKYLLSLIDDLTDRGAPG